MRVICWSDPGKCTRRLCWSYAATSILLMSKFMTFAFKVVRSLKNSSFLVSYDSSMTTCSGRPSAGLRPASARPSDAFHLGWTSPDGADAITASHAQQASCAHSLHVSDSLWGSSDWRRVCSHGPCCAWGKSNGKRMPSRRSSSASTTQPRGYRSRKSV